MGGGSVSARAELMYREDWGQKPHGKTWLERVRCPLPLLCRSCWPGTRAGWSPFSTCFRGWAELSRHTLPTRIGCRSFTPDCVPQILLLPLRAVLLDRRLHCCSWSVDFDLRAAASRWCLGISRSGKTFFCNGTTRTSRESWPRNPPAWLVRIRWCKCCSPCPVRPPTV